MKLKNYTVRLCRKDEYDKLISFLHDYWSPNHVFCRNKEIFEFQHGKAENGTYDFVIAVNNETDDIHAVLGFITSSRYDKSETGSPRAVYGALWKARDDVKDKESGKLGLAVLQYLLKLYPESEYITLGLSKDSQSIYDALHFNFGAMNHYYVANKHISDFKICDSPYINYDSVSNSEYEIKLIEKVPDSFDPYYEPKKNYSYIQNRYLDHPFYDYYLLGIYKNKSLVSIWVCRDCVVEDRKCIRIVDIIGRLDGIDDIEGNIHVFLNESGAEYLDCYNYGINKDVFLKIGFREIKGNTVIPNYFEPFEKKNVDIHYASYTKDPVVIFKGDGDQDRPNLLELK